MRGFDESNVPLLLHELRFSLTGVLAQNIGLPLFSGSPVEPLHLRPLPGDPAQSLGLYPEAAAAAAADQQGAEKHSEGIRRTGRPRKATKRLGEFVDSRTAVLDDGDPDYDLEADEDEYDSRGDSEEEADRGPRRLHTMRPKTFHV